MSGHAGCQAPCTSSGCRCSVLRHDCGIDTCFACKRPQAISWITLHRDGIPTRCVVAGGRAANTDSSGCWDDRRGVSGVDWIPKVSTRPRRANASCPDSLARRPDELGNFLASISQSPVTHSRSPFQFYAGGHPASIHGFLNQSCREVHHVRNHSGSGRPLIPIP